MGEAGFLAWGLRGRMLARRMGLPWCAVVWCMRSPWCVRLLGHAAAEGHVAALAHVAGVIRAIAVPYAVAVTRAVAVVPEWDMRCHTGQCLWPKGIGDWLDGPIQWHCIAAPV